MGRVGVWISAFLDQNTRKQAVGVDGRISELTPIVSGVPQGTVLGPVLFLIHIRNISFLLPLLMIPKSGEELKLQMTVPNCRQTCSQCMVGLKTST